MNQNNIKKEKRNDRRIIGFKTLFYIIILVTLLFTLNYLFGWETHDTIPAPLQPYTSIILLLNPYLIYIQSVILFVFGYLSINVLSSLIYIRFLQISDHPTAAAVRSIFKISGIAVLISVIASIFNVNPTAALTVGSFGGLVVGFATQTILSHVVAGIFLLLTRPFIYGDLITVSGQTGRVKEIKLMHLVLESDDTSEYILIPSGSVVNQVIHKKKNERPVQTLLTLDPLPITVVEGSMVEFSGRLVEAETGKPVSTVDIEICESDFGGDNAIVLGNSGDDGEFMFEWKSEKVDWMDRTVEVYAKFQGNMDYMESKSQQYEIKLEKNTQT
jgi:small-conductance mechanosensitive channel